MTEQANNEPSVEVSFDEQVAAFEAVNSRIADARREIARLSGDPEYDVSEAVVDLHAAGDVEDAYDLMQTEYAAAYGNEATAAADPHFAALRQSYKASEVLAAEILPAAEARFAEKAAAMRDTIDWDALIERMTAEHSNSDAGHVMRFISQPDKYGKGDLDDVLWALENMNRVHDELADEGFIKETAGPTSTEVYIGHGDLKGAITDWLDQTESATAYISSWRRSELHEALPHTELMRLASLAGRAGLDGSTEVTVPGVIMDAVQRAAAKRMTAFDNYDLEQLKKHHIERPNLTLITGGQRLTRTADIKDPQAFFDEMFHEWPHWLSRGIGAINVVRDIAPDQPHVNDDQAVPAPSSRTTTGEWYQQLNTLHINANEPYYEDMVAKHPNLSEDRVREVICKDREAQIRHTTVHELMHNAHGNILPIRWLREWDGIVTGRSVDVTDYVTTMRGKEKTKADKTQTKREDLCESVALYRYRPAHLLDTSASRFLCIQKLFDSYEESAVMATASRLSTLAPDDPDRQDRLNALDHIVSGRFRKAPTEATVFSPQQ